MDKLNQRLKSIEAKLGSTEPVPAYESDPLDWHLRKIESLIGGGGGDIELKTINGQSIKGEGNISITTYQAFPASWPVDNLHTTKQFCDAVNADTSAVIGMGYFGGAKWSDKPQGLANFDIVVEILEGPNQTKAIHLIGTSSSVYPYRWEYTYWSNGSVSGWRGVQPEIGINPTLSGGETSISSLQFGSTKYSVGGGTKLYRHHFDIVLTSVDLPLIPSGVQLHIPVNALSTDKESWDKLEKLDGGGFIITAFGMLSTYVFELKIYYKANETLLIHVTNLTDNSVSGLAITTVNGQTPSQFELEDSVTEL